MEFVQFFLLMLYAHLTLTFPPTQRTYNTKKCHLCPAGQFQASCTICKPCPYGRYTSKWNREDSCHRCYGDCSPSFHLKVVQNCSRTSDVKCVCEDGFRCTEKVPYSENCRECEKIQDITTTVEAAAVVISGKDKQTPSSASSGHSSTSSKPCKFPKCDTQSVQPHNTSEPKKSSISLAAVLCPVFLLVCLALVALFCIRRSRDNTCFNQTIAKLCNEKMPDASRRSTDSSHQFPRDTFGAKQQPSTLSATNLGPVYVHNPGTVIFSSVSQFTGQVGPTIEGGKTFSGASREEEEEEEEEEERNCPVYHPTSPHSLHLSQEEKSGEAECIFFPLQEQGKDYHMSKEEVL